MKLILDRIFRGENYTIGKLYADGVYICDTIEDKDRGLSQDKPLRENMRLKVKHRTAIPIGTYQVTLHIVSPKFNAKTYYHKFCNGKLPRLLDVPAFEGVLIHRGVTEKHSSGCIIVGKNDIVGQVSNSQFYFEKLYKLLDMASTKGEEITIQIK